MRIASFLASLLALGSATASAHGADLNAVWVQPVAPVVAGAAIVPLGWTHGLTPGADLVLEVTPYYGGGPPGGCIWSGCRDAVYGLIVSTGLAFGQSSVVTDGWEIGWFLGPKVLAAGARETGRSGSPIGSGEPPFVPGTAIEIGGGLDLGLEIHSRRLGLYAALVVGGQATMVFNYAENDLGGSPPTSPVILVHEPSSGPRDIRPMAGLNLNLLRIGFAF